MIIVFGSKGVLGEAIANNLEQKKVPLLLTAFSRFRANKPTQDQALNINLECDVTARKDVKKIFNYLKKNNLSLEGIINNFANTYEDPDGSIISSDPRVAKVFDVNYFGFLNVMEECVNFLNTAPTQSIRIVNVLSNSIRTLNASNHHYIASKVAIESMSKSYSKKYSHQLSINNVAPGLMKSNITKNRFNKVEKLIISKTPHGKLASPIDVAELISYLALDSPLSLCGQTIYIDGGRTI
tara:strand:+ start:175 stop:894 length:720 start_codon:yes stop_codon:yes gene_type:complete